MRATVRIAFLALILLACSTACWAAGHYSLAFWRTAGADESHGIAVMAVHVFNELGQPVSGATVHFVGPLGDKTSSTDYRGYAEMGFQFTGSPAVVSCGDSYGSTSDSTPTLYNHDSHRMYEIGFMYRTSASNPGVFDTSWCGDVANMAHCPSTASLTFNTPGCLDYYSDTRGLSANAVRQFGNTFVATSDRAVALRTHLTKGAQTRFRWTAQILEGGPDGPPMGPRKVLPNEYIEGDNKYLLSYAQDECALKVGNTYYVEFATADGSEVNAYECLNDVYSSGTLYENRLPVSGKELQAWVCGLSSGNTDAGVIAGTVTNSNGQPVPEATITLDPGGRTIQTGRAGTYKCYNIAPGTYEMTASASGYSDASATGRVVVTGGTLTTDFTLTPANGNIEIISTTGGNIAPGNSGTPVSMTVKNLAAGDLYVRSAGLKFLLGVVDCSSYFTVTPSSSNPAVIRGNGSAVFNFTVDSASGTPLGDYTVQGQVEADENLRPNGSFEADSYFPNYTGPSSWEWYSDEPPSVARLSYEHQVTYQMLDAMPATTNLARVRWIGKWGNTYPNNKKQGVRIYIPRSAGGTWRIQLNVTCSDGVVAIGSYGTGTSTYNSTLGKYYQIDGWIRSSDGVCQFVITPLEEPGKATGTINGTGASNTSTSLALKWGKMSDSGTEEMSCREFHYWFEDSSGSVIKERHWLASNGLLPTVDGWSMDSSGNQSMVPGAPWQSDTQFFADAGDKVEGDRSLNIWFSPSAPGKQLYISSGSGSALPRLPVRPLSTYTLSFWYKMATYIGPDNYQLKALWEEYDAFGQPYFARGTDPAFHYNEPEVSSSGWRKAVYTFTTTQWTQSCQFQLQLYRPSSAGTVAVVVKLDDVRLIGPNPYTDDTVTTPGVLTVQGATASVAAARFLPDGSTVSLTGSAVTGLPVDQAVQFYIEDPDRTAGILIDKTNGSGLLDVTDNDIVNIVGKLATLDGERRLVQPNVSSKTAGSAPSAIGLASRNLGGGPIGYVPGVDAGVGLNNVGLLVRVFGTVANPGAGYFYVDDGSGVNGSDGSGIKVISGSIPMQVGAQFALVTGFSSVEKVGGTYYRVIKPRRASDIIWY